MFSSIIMITSSLDILVKTKYWNQSAMNIPGPASTLIYNNSASPISLVCDLSHNVTSPTNLSNNFLFPNDHGIPFIQTLLRNFCYPPDLIVCSFFMCFPNTAFFPMSSPTKAQSLCQTSSTPQALLSTYSFTSLQTTILKMMDKLNTQTKLSSNTFIYIVITSKITGLNFCLSWSLPTITLQVLLPVFLHSLPIRDII